ncbi:hypothetical protein GQ43DRAFT_445527 [Delitschia confertaspora ATCC 74209]|uniref:Uncharacterized protein n=1 Tax=Delitschia confertaspora ATCC 74209 TaxID=1513339 RepID=A0A9P4MMI5_9PLEO|nr:hypothetical protein GQ43DRAFT_445527 [Delitschia confertaspora ATCC 74209]
MSTTFASNQPDLSLPSSGPNWTPYDEYNQDDTSFALYTLTSLSKSELEDLRDALDNEWWEKQGKEGTHLIRLPPKYDFSGKSLKDIVKSHDELNRQHGDELEWYPSAFVVVVDGFREKDGALLFVYEDTEDEGRAMSSFKFPIKQAYMVLSSIMFGDEDPKDIEANYKASQV